jgi:hypothetical protein
LPLIGVAPVRSPGLWHRVATTDSIQAWPDRSIEDGPQRTQPEQASRCTQPRAARPNVVDNRITINAAAPSRDVERSPTAELPYVALISTVRPSSAIASCPALDADREHGFGGGLANGPDQMSVKRKPPTRMYRFQLIDDDVELLNESRCPRSASCVTGGFRPAGHRFPDALSTTSRPSLDTGWRATRLHKSI